MNFGARTSLQNLGTGASRILDYWISIRGNRLLPARQDFDPMAVANLLPNIWIYSYEAERDDFVCRLAGESIQAAWGGRLRGRCYREIIGEEQHPEALERWKYLIEKPAIQHSFRGDLASSAIYQVAERLVLPLSDNGVPLRLLGYSRYVLGSDNQAVMPAIWDDSRAIDCVDL